MSSNKILNVQIINAHDTESNWKQVENDFVPFDGEMIVYSPDATHTNSRIKIGNGKDNLAKLNFFTGNIIKTKTAPGANNINTQNIYQVVDNNDEVVSYWYYSHGEWCELGTGNTGEASKSMINTTHSDLVSLRDSASLVPGQLYRITDYQCTTSQENTTSAGHKFDIIVRADSESILNENAWATYHYKEDGSTDGYFQKQIKTIVSASFKDGVDISDAGIIFTQSFDDNYWKPSDEWSEMNYLTTHEHPEWGVEVPAIYDPDPEDCGYNVIFIYEDSIARPAGNRLASIEAIMDPTGQEVLYTGSHNLSEFEDVLVYFDYQANTPVMRKTEAFIYENADMEELLVYNGDFTLDGVVYNQWNKLEGGSETYKILTNKIVENGQFIYPLDELQNAVIYETLDKWSEYEASTMRCNGYYRYTHSVVDAEFNEAFSVKRANLSAWELKYCLDNDEGRFYWADVENGRGVVYYMKDEYNNECSYDFKNILFEGRYTFNWHESNPLDLSIAGNNGELVNDEGTSGGVHNNIIKPWFEMNAQKLNHIVFDEDPGWDNGWFYGCNNNIFDYNCSNICFANSCSNNSFGANCMDCTFEEHCSNNIFGFNCMDCTFAGYCYNNTFESCCMGNMFEENCSNNTIGKNCYNNVLKYNCCFNHLGANCDYTVIEENCRYNRFTETSLVCLGAGSVNSIVEYVQGNDNRLKYVENPSEALAIIRPQNVREVLV